jgi:Flp pilus assembly protein TadG
MRKWRSDQSGATIIEFALVAPIFFLLILGIIEFGLIGFSQVAIESAVSATAREASIGKSTGGDRVQYVRTHIRKKLKGLINVDELVITANTVAAGGASQKADICLSNPPRIGGPCNPPLTYQDENGNGVYDATPPAVSLGNSGDLIEVRALYPWKIQLPFLNRFFGDNGIFTITSSTIVKNEPF